MRQPAITFGESLRHLGQRARLTQDELGIAVGYSRAHIARLENGPRAPDPCAILALHSSALCPPRAALPFCHNLPRS